MTKCKIDTKAFEVVGQLTRYLQSNVLSYMFKLVANCLVLLRDPCCKMPITLKSQEYKMGR